MSTCVNLYINLQYEARLEILSKHDIDRCFLLLQIVTSQIRLVSIDPIEYKLVLYSLNIFLLSKVHVQNTYKTQLLH